MTAAGPCHALRLTILSSERPQSDRPKPAPPTPQKISQTLPEIIPGYATLSRLRNTLRNDGIRRGQVSAVPCGIRQSLSA
jgi:hypothetical protein